MKKYLPNSVITMIGRARGHIKISSSASLYKNQLIGLIDIRQNSNIKLSILKGNITIHKNTEIYESEIQGSVSIGSNCKVFKVNIYGNITIGRNTSLWGDNINIHQIINPVTIGSFCSIAKNVSIQEYNHNHKKMTSYFIGKNLFKEDWANEYVSNGEINIGNDVWIGDGVKILSGCQIGNGCLIAANAIANKTYPDYSIVAGVPGKVVGYRFDEETIQLLQEIKWWEWTEKEILDKKDFFKNIYNGNELKSILKEYI